MTEKSNFKEYCVISHTHWDREWYQPFDLFRMRLVDLIDHLLDIFADDEEYIFHLDAQTVVLDDYLEIRPKRRGELEKYISNGQLIVGPWYVQNDFFLSSGESTVRNLLIGRRKAVEFGASGDVGYCPDQFGIIGQLPQIIKQFGLCGFVFGRGNMKIEENDGKVRYIPSPVEFNWEGPDGSRVLGIHMSRWYNNAQRFPDDTEKVKRLLKLNDADFDVLSKVPYRLLMNGVDHLEAQENLKPILEKTNAEIEDGCIYQGRLDEYVKKVSSYVEENDSGIPTVCGELRYGIDDQVLEGTLSSRVYLKQGNDRCENLLLYGIEPLYTMLAYAGLGSYPADYLAYLWRELVKNHAHDSICGCSNDAVHSEMEVRFSRITRTANELIRRGMLSAAHHMKDCAAGNDDYIITAANTVQTKRNEAFCVELRIPDYEDVGAFTVYDRHGNKIPFCVMSSEKKPVNIYSAINLPTGMNVMSYNVKLGVNDMAPYSFDYFIVRKNEGVLPVPEATEGGRTIENGEYKISAGEDGSLNLLLKKSGRTVENFLSFEDTADMGHSYVFRRLEGDCAISNIGTLRSCRTESDPFEECLYLTYEMQIPEGLDGRARSKNLIPHTIELKLTLSKLNGRIGAEYRFTNGARSHRMRAHIRTGIPCRYSSALSAFELVTKEYGKVGVPGHRGNDLPDAGLILLKGETENAAIYNVGLHEYEQLDCEGDIALTVLRSTGTITNDDLTRVGEDWSVPGCQCLREISGGFTVAYPGDIGEAVAEAASVRNGLVTVADSVDPRKFTGGRPALQDSAMDEIFFRPDEYEGAEIRAGESLIEVCGEDLVVTALKRARNSRETVLRFFNSSSEKRRAEIKLPDGTTQAAKSDLKEEITGFLDVNGGRVSFDVGPCEIVTLRFI